MKKNLQTLLVSTAILMASCGTESQQANVGEFKTNAEPTLHTNYPKNPDRMSAAMLRNNRYETEYPMENELYTNFCYTEVKGFDYNGGDGTRSRRDPSKIIFENGKFYVWYTHRNTIAPPVGSEGYTDEIPSTDWDLSEIWYATSVDGVNWEEQGVAVPRPAAPAVGNRSVSTADILKFKGKYYLYYQGFYEPSGKTNDLCPVTMSWADSPDGPWTPCGKEVVTTGEEGEWDAALIHDPFPLVHDGKIYIYYKSGFNHRDAGGVAIADNPEGPFVKYENNPVLNSGHEVSLFPFREGVAAMVIKAGNEHNTIQYAKDWVNFEIASFVNLMPNAPAGYCPDAFTDAKDARGITWGMCHFLWQGKDRNYSRLDRFECDLSQDLSDMAMKKQVINFSREVYMSNRLNAGQKKRIAAEIEKLHTQSK